MASIPLPPPPSANCPRPGYQVSGGDYRFAEALITVPDQRGTVAVTSPPRGEDPALYVALDNSSSDNYEFARAGIAPCPAGASDVFVVSF